jgi:hypothetical protein
MPPTTAPTMAPTLDEGSEDSGGVLCAAEVVLAAGTEDKDADEAVAMHGADQHNPSIKEAWDSFAHF